MVYEYELLEAALPGTTKLMLTLQKISFAIFVFGDCFQKVLVFIIREVKGIKELGVSVL